MKTKQQTKPAQAPQTETPVEPTLPRTHWQEMSRDERTTYLNSLMGKQVRYILLDAYERRCTAFGSDVTKPWQTSKLLDVDVIVDWLFGNRRYIIVEDDYQPSMGLALAFEERRRHIELNTLYDLQELTPTPPKALHEAASTPETRAYVCVCPKCGELLQVQVGLELVQVETTPEG